MSNLFVFREQALLRLQENIEINVNYYDKNVSWIKEYFGEHAWDVVSKVEDLPDDLLIIPDENSDYDFENSQRLYSALHGLSLTQASDQRMWAYLTHVKFWTYMRKRWPVLINSKNPSGTIRDRYFLIGDKSRGLTRNGVSRLWWAGHTCFDNSGVNDNSAFKLAKPLFIKQDVFASFMERAFSKNKGLMKSILSVLSERFEAGNPFDDREKVRSLAKYLVLVGGVTVLDAIDEDDFRIIVIEFINKIDA